MALIFILIDPRINFSEDRVRVGSLSYYAIKDCLLERILKLGNVINGIY